MTISDTRQVGFLEVRMVVDLRNDVMKVGACDDIEVPIVAVTRGSLTSATVYSSKRMTIPAHSKVAVPVTGPGKALESG